MVVGAVWESVVSGGGLGDVVGWWLVFWERGAAWEASFGLRNSGTPPLSLPSKPPLFPPSRPTVAVDVHADGAGGGLRPARVPDPPASAEVLQVASGREGLSWGVGALVQEREGCLLRGHSSLEVLSAPAPQRPAPPRKSPQTRPLPNPATPNNKGRGATPKPRHEAKTKPTARCGSRRRQRWARARGRPRARPRS